MNTNQLIHTRLICVRRPHPQATWLAIAVCQIWMASVGCGPPAAPPVSPTKPVSKSTSGATSLPSPATNPADSANRPAVQTPPAQVPTAPAAGRGAGMQGNSTASAAIPETTAPTGAKPTGSTRAASANARSVQEKPRPDDAGGRAWITLSSPLEYFETQYLNSQRIGVSKYRIERIEDDRLKLSSKTTMTVLRGKQRFRQLINVETYENTKGQVDSFFETVSDNMGPEVKIGGSISAEKLILKSSTAGQADKTVPWPSDSWGPMGVQQLLMRKPMVPDERRVTQLFLPQAHQIAKVTLVAGEIEDTTSPAGMLRQVTPIDVLMQLEKEGLVIRLWINSNGEILKTTWLQGLNLSSYRVSRLEFERVQAQGEVDMLSAGVIRVRQPLTAPEKLSSITYQIDSSEADPEKLLSAQSTQVIEKGSPYSIVLRVLKPQAEGQLPVGADKPSPKPTAKAASTYISSEDPGVVSLAKRLVGDERAPLSVALKLTEGIHAAMRTKGFTSAFESAQQVAQTLEGDCTEHAVLLAATLRSCNVPARLASGLVLSSSGNETVFVYHMWTEACIGDRWLPLDAMTGQPTHCGYIKFLETDLEGENPYTAVLKVLEALGKWKITVMDSAS